MVSTFTDKPDQFKISKDDYAFYNNLARHLVTPQSWEDLKCYFCQETVCQVCSDIYDVPHLCEECGSAFHKCCLIDHVITHNIGIPHIFRCPSCDNLLKIDEDEIVEISPEAIDEFETLSVKDYIEKDKTGLSPKNIEIKELGDFNSEAEERRDGETKNFKQKEVYIGGYFGAVFTVKKVGDKLLYERTSKKSLTQEEKNNKIPEESNYWKPNNHQIPEKIRIKICPMCGTQTTITQKKCLKCGHDFE